MLVSWRASFTRAGAITQAKVKTDASVAAKLWRRATGYELQEEKRTVVVTLTRWIPPDSRAAMLWLRKRQPKLWGEK